LRPRARISDTYLFYPKIEGLDNRLMHPVVGRTDASKGGIGMSRTRRGVHPALSEIILVAITLSIIVLAVSWILGVWSFEQEKFSVVPMLYIRSEGVGADETTPVLQLHIRNEGAREAVIVRVQILASNGYWDNSTRIVVPAGSTLDVVIDSWEWVGEGPPPELVPGQKYRVVIYTEQWGSIYFDVVVQG